ncbi:alpha/beta hydrolase [Pseudomonas syringae pv. syringae]|uniref:alpha/beta hydrolase n=1 Tax=Pseudomonas syringae TaxID=317 RepID=UPI0023F9E495|nr:alpha/beta hydrolase [Pseudomonas syringae]MDF5890230.1 alpha/beta hydrolase [Pseudomonas syringae pv. syringae]
MTLDVESARLLEQLAESGLKPFHLMNPYEAREVMASLLPEAMGPTMHSVEEVQLGGARLRILTPSASVRGAILYLHGGGWVVGGLDDFDYFARRLAHRTDCTVVLVDYRLAPEFPFPAALDDVERAAQWLMDRREQLAGSANGTLIVAGDSAGGNLAAVFAQRAAQRGQLHWALQVLIYPVTQADLDGPSYLAPQRQLLLTREDMRWFWDHYLPEAEQRQQVSASPLAAKDLRGVPPAVVLTAEFDVLRDEGQAYAARLAEAGIVVSERCFSGQMHGFVTMPFLSASSEALDWLSNQIEPWLQTV